MDQNRKQNHVYTYEHTFGLKQWNNWIYEVNLMYINGRSAKGAIAILGKYMTYAMVTLIKRNKLIPCRMGKQI